MHALQHQAGALVVRLSLAERLRSRRISYTYDRILIKSPCPLSGVRALAFGRMVLASVIQFHQISTVAQQRRGLLGFDAWMAILSFRTREYVGDCLACLVFAGI